MKEFVPLRHTVELAEVVETTDPFGNVITVPSEFTPVQVAGWAIVKTEESAGESVLRTVDQLDVYAQQPFDAGTTIRLPDGSVWEVSGNAEDYRHGPWWNPGLVVVHARKVEG